MSKNTHSRGAPSRPAPPQATPPRLTICHVLPLTVFPMVGSTLYALGMPMADVPVFLGWCGGIGAAVTLVSAGGRHALVALAHAVLAAVGSK